MIWRRWLSLRCFVMLLFCGIALAATSAHAEITKAQDIFKLIQSGNLAGAAQGLQTSIPATSGINPTQIAQIVSNLSAGNGAGQLNPASAIGLISGLMGGGVSGQLGQALSSVANLGNISGTGGIASLLASPQIGSLFSQITGGGAGAQQATKLLSTIMSLASNPDSLKQIASNPMSLVSSLLGGGGGGLGGLGNMISQALGGGGSNGGGGVLNNIAQAASVASPSSAVQSAASSAASSATSQAMAEQNARQGTLNQANPEITNNQQQGMDNTQTGISNPGSDSGCHIQNPIQPFTSIGEFAANRAGKNQTSGYDHMHKGVDIMNKNHSEVPSQPGCKVMMNGGSPLWPNMIRPMTARFDCGNGAAEVRYGHLKGCNPGTGMFITNYDAAPHVHYELLIKNPDDGGYYAVDPACAWGEWQHAKGNKCGQGLTQGVQNICDQQIQRKLIADAKVKLEGWGCPYKVGHCKSGSAFVQGKDPQAPGNIKGNPTCNGEGVPNPGGQGEDSGDTGHNYPQPPGGSGGSGGNGGGSGGDGSSGGGDPVGGTEVDDPKPELNESKCTTCCCPCSDPIVDDHNKRAGLHGIRPYFDQCNGQGQDCEKPQYETEESALKTHRDWLVYTFFQKQILPAMMLMTNQMTTVAMTQVAMIGSMLDAKHQLETQRLFQELQAQAHKDYHPSEGMCDIGTNARALASSDRRADLTQVTLSQRMISRGLISGTPLSMGGGVTDIQSRLNAYIKNYCNKADNGMNLAGLCTENPPKQRMNKDVDFTRTVDLPLTINADFIKDGTTAQPDAEDIFALSANLYGHDVSPVIKREVLANDQGLVGRDSAPRYLDTRAIMAKRSVAQNSFAAIAGMKASGGTLAAENGPFIKKLVTELGVPEADIEAYLGKEPSYFAQMEVLSKKIYQNPVFFNELYDKPVNVDRKAAAIEAIDLMQDRDIYRSILRSEAMSAVILETMLIREHDKLKNEINAMTQEGGR